MFTLNTDINHWVKKEFQTIDFGSKRLEKRFLKVMSDLSEEPEKSIWLSSGSRANAKAAYRMIGNEKFTKESILAAHKDTTNTRNQNNNTLLAIQDTMAVSYATHKKTAGLGYNCEKTLGINVHSCLLVTTNGIPIGLIAQSVTTRTTNSDPRSQHEKQKRKIQDKESNRWLQTMQTAQTNTPTNVTLIHIADREGDIYEWYAQALRTNQNFVIRAIHDRLTPNKTRLLDELYQSKPKGYIKILVPENHKTQTREREATLTLRYMRQEIKKPKRIRVAGLESTLSLSLVSVKEENPPSDVAALEWVLATSLELSCCEDALLVVDYYRQRWKIERFHFVLKSGCEIEKIQQHSVDRIELVVLMYSVISVHIMMLTYFARRFPDWSCELLFCESEWKTLYRAANRTCVVPEVAYSLGDALRFVAVLGGFVGAKSDGVPGLKVVWLGLNKLFVLHAFREFI